MGYQKTHTDDNLSRSILCSVQSKAFDRAQKTWLIIPAAFI